MKQKILPSCEFKASDRIFLGEGLFETLRVKSAKICYPKLHWQRMSNSAKALGIPFAIDLEDWLIYLHEALEKAGFIEGGIKVVLASNEAKRGLVEKPENSKLLIEGFESQPAKQPIKLLQAPWQRDAANPVYLHKAIHYLEFIHATRWALSKRGDDVVFFNTQNHVTETSIANIFLIKNNMLRTPSLDSGTLPGIIRQRIIHLCSGAGIACDETQIDRNSLEQADAVFTSNAMQWLKPVLSFENTHFSTQHPLLEKLNQLLYLDCEQNYAFER